MASVLSVIDVFRGIPVDGLADLASQGSPRTFRAGDELMRQGDPSDCMYVIVTGRVLVERSHPDLLEAIPLAEVGPGDVVGEMGLLDGEPRSATVTAIDDTETIKLGADVLTRTILRFPDVSIALLQMLSRRLRSTDELIAQQLRKRKGRN